MAVLEELEHRKLLFLSQSPSSQRNVPKILIVNPAHQRYPDTTNVAGGSIIASYHITKALSQYADIHILDEENRQLDDNIYGVWFDMRDSLSVYSRILHEGYTGILSYNPAEIDILDALSILDVPVFVRIYSPRGHGGDLINSIFRWHAFMRPFDRFIAPSEFVKQFYKRFFFNTDCFHVIHNGVDHNLFKPMDKQEAKGKVSKLLGRADIVSKPIVGFLSRFRPEKGAQQYVKAAMMNPEMIFLFVVPDLHLYQHRNLPENVIYAGKQERSHLPLFFNAFDVYCFPSMTGEESFGNAVLEAMACGTPPIVPDFASLPEVVQDAGVVVPAITYDHEIGSFAGWVSASDLSNTIRRIIFDEEQRRQLAKRSYQRAKQFTWENTARQYVSLFKQLHQNAITRINRNPVVGVAPYVPVAQFSIAHRACLFNQTNYDEHPFYFDIYPQTVEEGLAISLSHHHTPGEIEAMLEYVCQNREVARDIAERVRGFVDAIT